MTWVWAYADCNGRSMHKNETTLIARRAGKTRSLGLTMGPPKYLDLLTAKRISLGFTALKGLWPPLTVMFSYNKRVSYRQSRAFRVLHQ